MLVIGVYWSAKAQQEVLFQCPDDEFTFTGKPEKTLCEQYANFVCDIQIGAGTSFTKSSMIGSSITGNVCIIGDFEVDAPFTFQDAVVKINTGVTIDVDGSLLPGDPSASLGISNSKLFACIGLWKGIVLNNLP